jgi:autotransporter-associated beta strand protein
MSRLTILRSAIVGLVLLPPVGGVVHGQTWTGTTSSDWNTAGNWSPATVPNSATAVATFPSHANPPVNISATVTVQSLVFTIGSYTITASGGSSLLGATGITVSSAVTTVDQINLSAPGPGLASLQFPSGSSLTVTNNAPDSSGNGTGQSLVIGPNTSVGSAGSGGIVFTGVGTTVYSGSFASGGGNALTGGLTNSGPGFLRFSGDGTNLKGGLTLTGGTLALDYSTNTATKLNTSAGGSLTLGGGVLSMVPNASTSVTQTISGGTILQAGQTDVSATGSGAAITLGAGNITHNTGGTVDFALTGGPTFSVTTSASTNFFILPGYATVNGGATWATVSGGAISPLTTFGTNTFTSGTNVDVTSPSAPATFVANSLRFNTGNLPLNLTGVNSLQSGCILVTPNATGGTIGSETGQATDSLSGSLGELFVHQYGSSFFTINASLVAVNGLTKTGPSELVLSGTNTGLTGPINVNRGTLSITAAAAVNSASQINFNDARVGNRIQTFSFLPGNNISWSISPPIRLSAPGDNLGSAGITFSETGSGSFVTLAGVISSASGLTTPIRFEGDVQNNSAFNLTAANTFTGNLTLTFGSLGINSDASLGNTANTLSLGASTSGGLVFLNGGVTLAHSVFVNSGGSRVVSNGTDANTISGILSGGLLIKDGTGTLTLAGPNNTTGGMRVSAGTLRIAASSSFGNGGNFTVLAGAALSVGGIFTLAAGRTVILGPATGSGTAMLDVVAGQTLTVNGPVTNNGTGTAGLLKTGPGVLALAGTDTYSGGTTISAGSLSVAADAALGTGGNVTVLAGAALSAGGSFTLAAGRSVILGPATGGAIATLDVPAGQTLTVNGPVTDNGTGTSGAVLKTSPGTLVLGNAANTYSGGTTIQAGTVQAAADSNLGAAGTPVTVQPFGTLTFTGSTATARAFTLFNSPLTVATGATLTLNGGSAAGGVLAGPGSFALTGGAALLGMITRPNTAVNVAGTDSLTNVTNGAALTVAAGLGTPVILTGLTNQGSGAITIGAVNQVNAADFQTYGMLTINPAMLTQDFSQTTLMSNTGTSQLFFNGGSRTFVGTPATAVFPSNWPNMSQRGFPTFVAGIDLHGQNATVAGGLFVNNGYVEDTTNNGQGTATIVADFGSLVKGAGYFQNSVQTINGGKFQAGNSPGRATFGSFVLGPGGVSNYLFAIDDATGLAGPSPDAAGHVSGWGLVRSIGHASSPGDLTWTATPTDKLTVSLETLVNPTTVGIDVPGLMDHFDPTRSYDWPTFVWTGSYAGPADATMLDVATRFDTSGFANPLAGTFDWAIDTTGHTLSLTYTPSAVPEPSALVLCGIAVVAAAFRPQRRQAGLGRRS